MLYYPSLHTHVAHPLRSTSQGRTVLSNGNGSEIKTKPLTQGDRVCTFPCVFATGTSAARVLITFSLHSEIFSAREKKAHAHHNGVKSVRCEKRTILRCVLISVENKLNFLSTAFHEVAAQIDGSNDWPRERASARWSCVEHGHGRNAGVVEKAELCRET